MDTCGEILVEPTAVGVLLVGGFLGAGKTTLLSKLVRDPEIGGRLAVLVNELGDLGLDGELLASARGSSETASLRTVQLDSGCVCCTLKGELGQALAELARPASGPPPAQIIVELSGASLASEVHFQIATQAAEAPYFPDGLVCVVDAHAAPRWAREARSLFLDQLQRADLVLLSKLDLATPAERAETEALIQEHGKGARVVPCTFGDVPPALLLGSLEAAVPRAGSTTTHGLTGKTVRVGYVLAEPALERLLERLATSCFRIKGIVDVATPDGPQPRLVQCVGDQISITELPTPLGRAYAGPRRLVFIGPSSAEDFDAALRATAG